MNVSLKNISDTADAGIWKIILYCYFLPDCNLHLFPTERHTVFDHIGDACLPQPGIIFLVIDLL